MPRGGKRQGAGRKSTWNVGKTKAVKLPDLLLPEMLMLARVIDDSFADSIVEAEDPTFTSLISEDELVDVIYDLIYESQVLEAIAKKLLTNYLKLIEKATNHRQNNHLAKQVKSRNQPFGSGSLNF